MLVTVPVLSQCTCVQCTCVSRPVMSAQISCVMHLLQINTFMRCILHCFTTWLYCSSLSSYCASQLESCCTFGYCRKIDAFIDDPEVVIPLRSYNPETRTKISSHGMTTAKSTACLTPKSQEGSALHHMKAPCLPAAVASGCDMQSSMV